ncbi:hypothetical protein BDN72DRAFT_834601 [Pluteus cervinus]|uniref:Uncharacterized protein n=1 Tax=Pluteus cervinus TaxID=181527 RepID=A0ACD3B907_9AGAR|nr:hypothetical protein BDN72DRAFT_834601 [Pluteus cervinus]
MSFLVRLLQGFRSQTRLVGRDLEGNKFYESPNALGDGSRPRRTVQYHDPEAVWDYVGGKRRLPVQWSMWLSYTRPHAPTLEELQLDIERQRRVLANAAILEAQEQAQKLASLEPPTPPSVQNTIEASQLRPQPEAEQPKESPWKAVPESWQPESWSPQPRKKAS